MKCKHCGKQIVKTDYISMEYEHSGGWMFCKNANDDERQWGDEKAEPFTLVDYFEEAVKI